MSNRAGYQPISQSAEEENDVGEGSQLLPNPNATRANVRPRPASIDLSKLDHAFKRWTESIAQRVKRKKSVRAHTRKQIWKSVFEPTILSSAPPPLFVKTLDHKPPMTPAEFEGLVTSVKSAISEGIHPKMITKGSSGSYFARAKGEHGRVQTVAVFKPKDEEPYGALNPKTTKWIHRQFRWIIPFGRACLIPNLSYISEAAASLLDERLQLYIVPPTKLVSLSSLSFFYDWLDRNAFKKGKKPLPDKIGSMQFFLHGFQDASEFLRKHPWPGRAIADTFDDSTHRQGSVSKRFMTAMKVLCGRTGDSEDIYDDIEEERLFDATEADPQTPFYWSGPLQQSFREELEKLVILDYLMLNTDRGADNYMIKYCEVDHEKSLVDIEPTRSTRGGMPVMSELRKGESTPRVPSMEAFSPYPSFGASSSTTHLDYTKRPHIHIAAIDNSLSFPHEHPHGWRSYTYGWLYLPVSVIGRPFSEQTRDHFLPLLTSRTWWEETTYELKKLFAVDPDFHPKMFRRQLAVIKGQAWNIVQSLKHADEGPLELTRRQKVLVWDDEVDLNEDDLEDNNVGMSSPRLSISSVPLPPRRTRSQSSGDFPPPPMQRGLTDASGSIRPVPFSSKFQRIHPGTTGVTVLEHLERLDAVEASLKRLNADEEDEEVDVGELASSPRVIHTTRNQNASLSSMARTPPTGPMSPILSPPGSPLPTVQEVPSMDSSMTEEDLVTMSRSTSHVEPHSRWASQVARDSDWLQNTDPTPKRAVIVERMETVEHTPVCGCW